MLQKTTATDANYIRLVTLLDADLKIKDGDEHQFFANHNKSDDIQHILLFYIENQAVACGAFKHFDAATAEIKRMFVLPEQRGRGIAHQILQALEQWAAEQNYTQIILETGKKMTDAIALYQRAGYAITPNYGQYIGVESCVCMQKYL